MEWFINALSKYPIFKGISKGGENEKKIFNIN